MALLTKYWRDTLERLFWTTFSAVTVAVLAAGPFDAIGWRDAALAAAGTTFVNWVTLVARDRLAVLPDVGTGVPGARVG